MGKAHDTIILKSGNSEGYCFQKCHVISVQTTHVSILPADTMLSAQKCRVICQNELTDELPEFQ